MSKVKFTEMEVRTIIYKRMLEIETHIIKSQSEIDCAIDLMKELYGFVAEEWPFKRGIDKHEVFDE